MRRSPGAALVAWTRERFPLANVPLILLVYLAALACGRAATHAGALHPRAADVAGFVAVGAYFLMLRAIDDQLDYERDAVDHPDRLLQRGLVTRQNLRLLVAAAVVLQLAVSLAIGTLAALAWLVAIAYVALSANDFVVGERALVRRPLLHRLLRVPASGLAIAWMAQIGAGARGLPLRLVSLVALGLLITTALDAGRKLAPRRPSDESWAASLGAGRAIAALAAILVAYLLVAALVIGACVGPSAPADAALAGIALVAVALLARPSAQRRVEAVAGAVVLAGLTTLLVTIVASRSVA